MSESGAHPKPEAIHQTRAWFPGTVSRAGKSPFYWAGLVGTAFAMMLLPMLYLGLITAVIGITTLWLRVGLVVFESHVDKYAIIAYCGPILIGVVWTLFLLKPFFAPPQKRHEPVRINLAEEPLLADFIQSVCAVMRAPVPIVVYVDCGVNASAGFKGGWRGMMRRDMALTIGLPLVAGLDARQFAGVLAHEFGHFTQRAGMTASFVIRTINHWFSRVVHERDRWDMELEDASTRGGILGVIAAMFARGLIWLSRQILLGLMHLGQAIGCFQLRQMEFDADYYEIQLVGSGAFIATSTELDRLCAAHADAVADLQSLWRDRRLPEDFPALVMRRRHHPKDLPPRVGARPYSGWFSSHPTTQQRNQRAIDAEARGFFSGRGPAVALFNDFPVLSRKTSRQFFSEEAGLSLKDVVVADATELMLDVDAEREAATTWTAFAGPTVSLERPFLLGQYLSAQPTSDNPVAARQRFHSKFCTSREAIVKLSCTWDRQSHGERQALVATRLLSSGIGVAPDAFGISAATGTAAEARIQELATEKNATTTKLNLLMDDLGGYLGATISLAQQQEGANCHARTVVEAARSFIAIEPIAARYTELSVELTMANLLAANATQLQGNPTYHHLSVTTQRRLVTAFNNTLAAAAKLTDPFRRQPRANWTFANHLRNLLPQQAAPIEVRTTALLQAISSVYFRLLAQIHFHGIRIEPALSQTPPSLPASASLPEA